MSLCAAIQSAKKPAEAPLHRTFPATSLQRRQSNPQAHTSAPAGNPVGHNYSGIRINPTFTLAEHRLHQGTSGDTGCDVSVGTPTYDIHSPSLCYRDCTTRHEALHVADLTPCCKKSNQAYKAATTGDKQSAVQGKMNAWVQTNRDYFECRAYGESVRCANEFLAAHCAAPGSTGESPSGAQPQSATQDLPDESLSQNLQESAVLDNNPPGNPSEAPIDPKICCSTVKEYARVQGLRRDNFCATAKKSLTPCPF